MKTSLFELMAWGGDYLNNRAPNCKTNGPKKRPRPG